MAVAAQGCERTGCRERLEIAAVEPGTDAEILDTPEGTGVARGHQALRPRLRERLDQAQAEAQCRLAILPPLESRIPVTDADIHRSHLDTVRARIAYQLCRGITAHGLAV